MAFPKQPVINVKTTDTTGYIMEFFSQTTMGPSGCVRVTTRDVLKLSAVSQTINEIIPVPPSQNTKPFPTGPEVVVISPTQCGGFSQQPTVHRPTVFQPCKPDSRVNLNQSSRPASTINVNCVSMEDVACMTENVCKRLQAEACSQTDVVKCCEIACGKDDKDYFKDDKDQGFENLERKKKKCEPCKGKDTEPRDESKKSKCQTATGSQKKCEKCSSNHDSVKTDDAKNPPDKKKCACSKKMKDDSEMKTPSSSKRVEMDTGFDSEGSKKKSPEDGNDKRKKSHICRECRSKSNCRGSQTEILLNKKEKTVQISEKEIQDGDEANKASKQNSYVSCRIECEASNQDKGTNKECEEDIIDVYKNKEFNESKACKVSKKEDVEMDVSQTVTYNPSKVDNSFSLMNVDIVNISRDCSSSSTSDIFYCTESDSGSSLSSVSVCSACRSKENTCAKSGTTDPDKRDPKKSSKDCNERQKKQKCEKSDEASGKAKSATPKLCRKCKLTLKTSKMSVSDCGTSTSDVSFPCASEPQKKAVCLRDAYVQCEYSPIHANVCVDTNDKPRDQKNFGCMAEPKEGQSVSIRQSIMDFITRYVWGEPTTRDSSTQYCDTSTKEESCQCVVWCGNTKDTNQDTNQDGNSDGQGGTNKCGKPSSSQMDIDDRPASDHQPNNSREENEPEKRDLSKQKHILKKHGDKMECDNCSTESLNKRNVNFNPEAVIMKYDSKEQTTVESKLIDENEVDRSKNPAVYDIFKDPHHHWSDDSDAISLNNVNLEDDTQEFTEIDPIASKQLKKQSVTSLEMSFEEMNSFDTTKCGKVKERSVVTSEKNDQQMKSDKKLKADEPVKDGTDQNLKESDKTSGDVPPKEKPDEPDFVSNKTNTNQQTKSDEPVQLGTTEKLKKSDKTNSVPPKEKPDEPDFVSNKTNTNQQTKSDEPVQLGTTEKLKKSDKTNSVPPKEKPDEPDSILDKHNTEEPASTLGAPTADNESETSDPASSFHAKSDTSGPKKRVVVISKDSNHKKKQNNIKFWRY